MWCFLLVKPFFSNKEGVKKKEKTKDNRKKQGVF